VPALGAESAAAGDQEQREEQDDAGGKPGLEVAGNHGGSIASLGETILSNLGELPPGGYVSNQVAARLPPAAAEAMSRLRIGLNANAARMASGRFVQDNTDNTHVVIWLLEQIALAGTTSVTIKSAPRDEVP
jgi:hypothetical protein